MIDREKVVNGLLCIKGDYIPCASCKYALKEQPKKAHWVKMTGMMPPEFTGHFECDNCGWHGKPFVREIDFAYCPGCGAKMSIDGLHADDCKKTPFDRILKDYLETYGGVVKV